MRRLLLSVILLSCASVSGTLREPREYRLHLFHTHTHERLDVVYRRDDVYDVEALRKLDYFLRDHRVGAVRRHDPRLFDLLAELTARTSRSQAEIHVICGYRTPESNQWLRDHTAAVAKRSLHMQAEAVDIRIPGLQTSHLRDTALALARGGVGYYASSDFVHLDVGRVRRW